MAETFTGTFKVSATGNLASSADLQINNSVFNYSKVYSIANGTGADSANNVWTDTRTIAASGSDDLDLAGVLINTYGTTLTFTKIKGIIVEAASGNTNDVQIGGDAASFPLFGAVNDYINVKPGGIFAIYTPGSAGYAITATTADILQIANSSSGTSVTYNIVIIGCV